eukprot:TRINITY_DN23324_c0_g2_i3.p1 TRINITY_DN23324_c0_g2~~TRINITY_DN23324_c0_g2_i3.p1  ORF type:complete len:369 (+),score=49.25 TRINITY_DN23324_c0_g2_i3:829-1935(+)
MTAAPASVDLHGLQHRDRFVAVGSRQSRRRVQGWERWRSLLEHSLTNSLEERRRADKPGWIPCELHHQIVRLVETVELAQERLEGLIGWLVRSLDQIGHSLWANAGFVCTQVYGSRATGLALAEADVDIVLCFKWTPSQMQQAERVLQLCHWLDQLPWALKVEPIPFASTPLLHMNINTEHQTPFNNLPVDISLGGVGHAGHHGTAVAQFVKQLNQAYPPLRPCVIYLKSVLEQAGVLGSANGGMSGYMLVLMAAHFLIPRVNEQQHDFGKIATLMIKHLLKHLNPEKETTTLGMSREKVLEIFPGATFSKSEEAASQPSTNTTVIVLDPLQPGNNVARLCYRLSEICEVLEIEMRANRRRCFHSLIE